MSSRTDPDDRSEGDARRLNERIVRWTTWAMVIMAVGAAVLIAALSLA